MWAAELANSEVSMAKKMMPFVTLADWERRQDLNCHPQNAGGGQGQVTHEGSAQTTGPDRSAG